MNIVILHIFPSCNKFLPDIPIQMLYLFQILSTLSKILRNLMLLGQNLLLQIHLTISVQYIVGWQTPF